MRAAIIQSQGESRRIACGQIFENTYTRTARMQSYPVGQPTSPLRAAHLDPSPSHTHIIGDIGRNGGSTGGASSNFGPCTSLSRPASFAARQVAQRVASWFMWLCDRKSFQFMASSHSRPASRNEGRVELGCAVRFVTRPSCVSVFGADLI